MSQLPKRKISELFQLYKLEPALKDIFVEGNSDKFFYEYFLDRFGIKNFRVYSIDTLDFINEINLDDTSNRNKLIQLSILLLNRFEEALETVTCIVDKDLHDIIQSDDENFYLFFTDYASLEMFFVNEKTINKFLKIGLNNFPISSKELIKVISKPLQEIFVINCAKVEKYKSASRIVLDNAIKVHKNCTIEFSSEQYLDKFLLKNNLSKERQYFQEKITELNKRLTNEYRNQMRGKDFLELFFKVVKVVVNNPVGYTIDSLFKSLLLSIEENDLKESNLFQKLLKRYE